MRLKIRSVAFESLIRPRRQNSNEFINAVAGVSFTALKVNSAPNQYNTNQYNTIEVQEDNIKV